MLLFLFIDFQKFFLAGRRLVGRLGIPYVTNWPDVFLGETLFKKERKKIKMAAASYARQSSTTPSNKIRFGVCGKYLVMG